MANPMIFDCWMAYGPRPAKDAAERWTLSHLLEDMDLYGISAGLVRHEQGAHYDPMFINRRLADEISDHRDRLFPCWNAMPHQAGDFPDPGTLLTEAEAADVRAFMVTPATHGYPIHADVLSPLADALNERHACILTTLPELGNDYGGILSFCRLFPRCPIILADASWATWRLVTAVMDACPNVHAEFSALQANRAVEWFSDRYGSDRVLLGTGLLRRSGGAARGFVDWSLLADETERTAFAGGNLVRLLDVGSPSGRSLDGPDELVADAAEGRPLSSQVLDAHCHVLDDGLNGAGARYVMIRGDSLSMLELSDRMGVDVTAMMSWSGTVSMDVAAGNLLMEKVVERSPEKVLGLSSCDPTHQSPGEIRATCERLHGALGFRGMKPYTRNNVPYNDPRYSPYWEYANEHRLYGLLHTAPAVGGMRAVTDLASRYPEVTFLVAHTGGSWTLARQTADAAADRPNIVAELTYTGACNGIIEWLCEQIGPDRVLFGTDAPMRDPRPQLGWCVYTRLPVEQKRMIVGGNFARILSRGCLPGHTLPSCIKA